MPSLPPFLKRFGPALGPVPPAERLRAALGAVLGLVMVGILTGLALGDSVAVPLLIAPMGASAVLLFAVPSSPLAQPWSMLAGNLLSAIIGVTAARWIHDPILAAGLAGGIAIAAMSTLRCLHPPSGAVALTAVLGGPAVHALGYGFVLWPVGINSILLVVAAVVFNGLTGKSYPHRPIAALDTGRSNPPPGARLGVGAADLDAVLKEYGQLIDVDRGDLAGLLREAQLRAYRRRSVEVRTMDIMSRDIVAVSPGASLKEAFELLRAHRLRALPVTGEDARVVGILTQTDLLDRAAWSADGPRIGWRHRLRRLARLQAAPEGSVADVMTSPVRSASPDTPISDLVPLMADGGLHVLPVVDARGQLAGVVSQSDLIAALFDERLAS